MLRRAGALTLLVYALHTLAACALGAPLALDLARALSAQLYRAQLGADDAALVLELGARRLPNLFTWGAVSALVYALLAPALRVAWLHAMPRSCSLRACLAYGRRRYFAALAVGTGASLLWALLMLTTLLAFDALSASLPPSVAGEVAGRALCVTLAIFLSLLVATLHDLAIAALADSNTRVRHALHSARRALSLPALLAHGATGLAAAICLAGAESLAHQPALATSPLILLSLQQLLVFAATSLRATWLALALQRIDARYL